MHLRRLQGTTLKLVRPCQPEETLAAKPGAKDELVFTLPDLAPWSVCTVFSD